MEDNKLFTKDDFIAQTRRIREQAYADAPKVGEDISNSDIPELKTDKMVLLTLGNQGIGFVIL